MTTFLIVVALAIAFLLLVIALRPPDFRVSRSIVVNAPAAKPFALVNDFRRWEAWSPWEKVDPNVKREYDGAPQGAGAKYHWLGNRNVGEGRMEILESKPNELVRIRLQFLKPMAATHTTDFTFAEQNNATTVTQTMYGNNSFLAKAMGLVMNMDKMIGPMFEKGLADVKRLSESQA